MARALGEGRIDADSAGLAPTGHVSRFARAALEELGYPSDGLTSKGVEEMPLESYDVIVSLTGPEGLRSIPSHLSCRREVWKVRDPYGDDEEMFLLVARTLEDRIRDLFEDLLRAEPILG